MKKKVDEVTFHLKPIILDTLHQNTCAHKRVNNVSPINKEVRATMMYGMVFSDH